MRDDVYRIEPQTYLKSIKKILVIPNFLTLFFLEGNLIQLDEEATNVFQMLQCRGEED